MESAYSMNKTIAILQSAYIPWKGYFDLINSVDEFIIFDDAQFTKGDWRNRNRIKTAQGTQWLTIPVVKERLAQRIRDTRVSDRTWTRKHWSTVSQCFAKAAYFEEYRDIFESLYRACAPLEFLSDVNYLFLSKINEILGISKKLRWSSEFQLVEGRTERLLDLCRQCGATRYLSGPAAKSYFDIELANKANIEVAWMDYSYYSEYTQLYGDFEHGVTILDLLFNVGESAHRFMKSFEAKDVD